MNASETEKSQLFSAFMNCLLFTLGIVRSNGKFWISSLCDVIKAWHLAKVMTHNTHYVFVLASLSLSTFKHLASSIKHHDQWFSQVDVNRELSVLMMRYLNIWAVIFLMEQRIDGGALRSSCRSAVLGIQELDFWCSAGTETEEIKTGMSARRRTEGWGWGM